MPDTFFLEKETGVGNREKRANTESLERGTDPAIAMSVFSSFQFQSI